jgi:hypothetical protein
MPDTTANLGLPFLQASQADKHVAVNAALATLDGVVQASVVSRTVLVQPPSPSLGDAYILPPGKSGASWTSFPDNSLAIWSDTGWQSFTPKQGFTAFVPSENQHITRTTTGWAALSSQVRLPSGLEVLINSAFSVWQRGTALALTSGQAGYLADRWRHEAGTAGVANVSRIALPAGTIGLPEWAIYGISHAQTTAATTPPRIEQRIETVRRFGATTITMSAFARVVSGTANVTPKAILNFGTGGPASVVITSSPWALTTTWQRLSATFAIPTIATITTVEWPNNHLSVGLDLPTGVVTTVEMGAAQFDFGPVANAVRTPENASELARCQRYFAKTFALDTPPASNTSDGGGIFQAVYATGAYANILPWLFPTPMRVSPQITTFNPYTLNGSGMALAGSGNFLVDTYSVNQNGVMIRNTQVLSGAPVPINLHVTANAEL